MRAPCVTASFHNCNFVHLQVVKSEKYKTYFLPPSCRLGDKNRSLACGIKSTIMDKSLGTNLHLWRFFTRAKQIHLHLFIPSPSAPSYNVEHVYTLFLQSFDIVLGEGRGQHILKRITVLFENSILKTLKINAIT